jgi:UDP-N-acetylmuramate dehydrogenase
MTSKQNIKYVDMAQKFNLQTDVPLSHHTSFRVGGPADLLALPETLEDLRAIAAYASANDIPVTIIGGGTNILVRDKGIRGLVILTTSLKSGMNIRPMNKEYCLLQALAGEKLPKVLNFAMSNSLSGLEFAAGIPGTFGGAIAMNAGGASENMGDLVRYLIVLNRKNLRLHIFEREDLNFSYRNLELPGIIIAATLALKPGKRKNIEKNFQQALSQKKVSQPVSAASAGCFFKNPAQGMSAGEMIDRAGLKGMKMGGAMVSPVHANYIVNTGNATCEDILNLKEHIEKIVFSKFHVQLETEVRIEGEET